MFKDVASGSAVYSRRKMNRGDAIEVMPKHRNRVATERWRVETEAVRVRRRRDREET